MFLCPFSLPENGLSPPFCLSISCFSQVKKKKQSLYLTWSLKSYCCTWTGIAVWSCAKSQNAATMKAQMLIMQWCFIYCSLSGHRRLGWARLQLGKISYLIQRKMELLLCSKHSLIFAINSVMTCFIRLCFWKKICLTSKCSWASRSPLTPSPYQSFFADHLH